MPEKFKRCVFKVMEKNIEKGTKYNPYAVCRKSTGYYGTTHDVGILHPKRRK
jgi:hypothetical protein